MNFVSIIKYLSLLVYLFWCSVFFHTQAMWIWANGLIEWNCMMHHEVMWEQEDIPANSNCFETCLWAYDDFSTISNELETTTFHLYDFSSNYSHLLENRVFRDNISIHIDEWGYWICSPPFFKRYIKITKKLE